MLVEVRLSLESRTYADVQSRMTIGLIGTGSIGGAIAKQFSRKKIEFFLANEHGPEALAKMVEELGPCAHATTVNEAAMADIVILAVPWAVIPEALAKMPAWNNRILIDVSNALALPDFHAIDLGEKNGRKILSTEIVAEHAKGARVVKAFNTLNAATLAKEPSEAGGRRVLFLSGNDQDARAEVAALIEKMGFFPIDLGELTPLQHYPGAVTTLNLIKMD